MEPKKGNKGARDELRKRMKHRGDERENATPEK